MSNLRNIRFHPGAVSRSSRESILRQRGCVIWLTGLSGSGKSTIARALEQRLVEDHHLAYVLDGDNIRFGLCSDLGFSPEDRQENIRRIGEVAALFVDAGLIVIAAFISPYRADRAAVRALNEARYLEIFIDAPVHVCEERDPKGLYSKARAGAISDFTGVSAPYEPPEAADLVIPSDEITVEESVQRIIDLLESRDVLSGPTPESGPAST